MKKILLTSISTVLGAITLITPAFATTSVSFTPANINVVQGQSFNLKIVVNPKNIKNYTVKMVLNYPANLLEVKSFNLSDNWMPVINQPGYDLIDNTNGILIKTAGYPNGITSTTTFGTVSFLSKKTGTGVIKVGDKTLILDANNKNVLSGYSVAPFKIIAHKVVPKKSATKKKTTKPSVVKSCGCQDWSAWQDKGCGEGDCLEAQRLQVRNRSCEPSGCDVEKQTQCVDDSTCVTSAKTPKTPKVAAKPAAAPPTGSPWLASIGSIITLGTGSSLIAILLGLVIILLISLYFIRRNRLKK